MNLFLSQLKTLTAIWLILCVVPFVLYLLPPSWHPVPLNGYFFVTLVLLLGFIAALLTLLLHNLTTSHLQQVLLLAENKPDASLLILDHRYRILHADQSFIAQQPERGEGLFLCSVEQILSSPALTQLIRHELPQRHWQGKLSLADHPVKTPQFEAQLSTVQGLLPWHPYRMLWLTAKSASPFGVHALSEGDYDATTGLINAKKFNQLLYLQTRVQHRYCPNPSDCFALCHIDAFEVLRERHGADIGDKILIEIARRLNVSLRDTDIIARTDEDEFALMIRRISIEDACALLERIGQDIATSSQQLFTVSIGVCQIDTDQAQTYQQARTALARAKNKGRNCVSAYNYNHFKLVGKSD